MRRSSRASAIGGGAPTTAGEEELDPRGCGGAELEPLVGEGVKEAGGAGGLVGEARGAWWPR